MEAGQTLSRSYFFLFPGVAHAVLSPPSACPDDIEQGFLQNPTEKPDASCIRRMSEPVFT